MDIRKYFKKLEEKLTIDNPALSLNCPERSKKEVEPITDLWQGGAKTENKKTREKFETKSTSKRSRTSLSEEEEEHYQCRVKKRRNNEELIVSQGEKMENRGDEASKKEREKIHHTLMGVDKPAEKPSETKKKFSRLPGKNEALKNQVQLSQSNH